MNFLCPACRTPLSRAAYGKICVCSKCAVEVDLTRVETAAGQARLWPELELSGEQLGAYRVLKVLGHGGMGTVYEAEGPNGAVALKTLSSFLAAEPALRQRFRREAQALRQLVHPAVVRIVDEGEAGGVCWYAMERVEGSDLKRRLERGPLQNDEVEALAKRLLSALAAVHRAGMVHRDLKPANILLSSQGAKLCDFGIAHLDGSTTLTTSSMLLGSLKYMSPEQRAGKTSAQADLYSLGVVLHEALAGDVPGQASLPSTTTRSLRRLVQALLQEACERRPTDAHAALKLLEPRRSRLLPLFVAAVLAITSAVELVSSPATPRVMGEAPPFVPSALAPVVETQLMPMPNSKKKSSKAFQLPSAEVEMKVKAIDWAPSKPKK